VTRRASALAVGPSVFFAIFNTRVLNFGSFSPSAKREHLLDRTLDLGRSLELTGHDLSSPRLH
jgi:hypothetical protein